MFRPALFVLILASTALAETRDFYVAVNVTAPQDVKDSISTEIIQALRRFPDVKVIGGDETYTISVVCMDVQEHVNLACALDITLVGDIDWWKDSVRPQNLDAWRALVTLGKNTHAKVLQQVYVLGVNRFEWFGHDIADTLDTRFLEEFRQIDAAADRVKASHKH
ncbi:MAG: hypothetical protein M3Y57_13270 [Acidobacteriota bacterium]|nr:hypothetical protein [Acidobacteriota bacterium]